MDECDTEMMGLMERGFLYSNNIFVIIVVMSAKNVNNFKSFATQYSIIPMCWQPSRAVEIRAFSKNCKNSEIFNSLSLFFRRIPWI